MTVMDVVLFGNLVQSIDAGISPFQTFGQMRPGSHVLIARPMKFHAGFSQPFLKVHTPSFLGSFPFDSPSPLGGRYFFFGGGARVFIFSQCCNPSDVLAFCLGPNLPTRVRVLIVLLLEQPFAFAFTPRNGG